MTTMELVVRSASNLLQRYNVVTLRALEDDYVVAEEWESANVPLEQPVVKSLDGTLNWRGNQVQLVIKLWSESLAAVKLDLGENINECFISVSCEGLVVSYNIEMASTGTYQVGKAQAMPPPIPIS